MRNKTMRAHRWAPLLGAVIAAFVMMNSTADAVGWDSPMGLPNEPPGATMLLGDLGPDLYAADTQTQPGGTAISTTTTNTSGPTSPTATRNLDSRAERHRLMQGHPYNNRALTHQVTMTFSPPAPEVTSIQGRAERQRAVLQGNPKHSRRTLTHQVHRQADPNPSPTPVPEVTGIHRTRPATSPAWPGCNPRGDPARGRRAQLLE